jgi:hypothetical protein
MALPIRRDGGGVHTGGGLSATARRKFLRFFPGRFYDQKFIDWERGYKWAAHQAWDHVLNQEEYRRLLRGHEFQEIADLAVAIEARTHLGAPSGPGVILKIELVCQLRRRVSLWA